MARVNMTLCDMCADLTPSTHQWQIKGPNGTRIIDLCDQHAEPLQPLYKAGSKPQAQGRTSPVMHGPGSRLHVVTVEEIQRLKEGR